MLEYLNRKSIKTVLPTYCKNSYISIEFMSLKSISKQPEPRKLVPEFNLPDIWGIKFGRITITPPVLEYREGQWLCVVGGNVLTALENKGYKQAYCICISDEIEAANKTNFKLHNHIVAPFMGGFTELGRM